MTGFGTATVKIPAATAAATPFGESSKAIASSGAHAQRLERLEVEHRARLAALAVAVGAEDARPAVGEPEPLEVALDPVPRAARHDPDLEAERGARPRGSLDARRAAAQQQQLALARAGGRRSRPRGRPAARAAASSSSSSSGPPSVPIRSRKRSSGSVDAVRLEDLLPGAQVDRLRVDDRPVEVEQERPHPPCPSPQS